MVVMGIKNTKQKKVMEALKKVWEKILHHTTDSSKSRPLFTDGLNSFFHFIFGVLAIRYSILIPLFISYQLLDPEDVNIFVDINEFIIGYIVGVIMLNKA
jgi:hypothetical protein